MQRPTGFTRGCIPLKETDRWIAISCATPADWQRVCEVAGLGTSEHPATLDGALGRWTSAQPGALLMSVLQDAGVAAGLVQDIEDLTERDPQLKFRGALTQLDHPLLGPFGHVRTPITFSRSTPAPFRAPRLGEHSAAIARDIAGLDEARILELEQAGIFQ